MNWPRLTANGLTSCVSLSSAGITGLYSVPAKYSGLLTDGLRSHAQAEREQQSPSLLLLMLLGLPIVTLL